MSVSHKNPWYRIGIRVAIRVDIRVALRLLEMTEIQHDITTPFPLHHISAFMLKKKESIQSGMLLG